MEDLISTSQEAKNALDSGLLNKTLNLFRSQGEFNTNVSAFLQWISNTYYPHLSLFVPNVSVSFREYFQPQIVVYGNDPKNIESQDLLKSIKAISSTKDSVVQCVSHEVQDEVVKKELSKLGASSVFIIPLVIKGKQIGTLAFLEEEVPRLWSKKESEEILNISNVFAQFLYTEMLDKELFAKEEILQKAIESSNDGYWHIDLKQNKMHFSRQWKRMLGFNEDELVDSFETFENLLHPDDKEVVLHVLDPYLKIGVGSYECEYRIRNKEGKYLWVLTRAKVNFSENGIPLQFVATNTDITSRIEYKRILANSEAKYKKLLGSIHEIIFGVDRKGIITFLNDAWERHLLFKVSKTLGKSYFTYIHPEDRPIAESVIKIPYDGEDIAHVTREIRLLAANGKSVWMEVHFSLYYGEDEQLEEVKGTLVNIDERKLVELEKAASDNKLARISENISDLIVEIDESGEYVFMSNASRNMLGRNPKEFIGRKAIEDVHPDEKEDIHTNLYMQLLNGAKRLVSQYRFKTGFDDYIWVESIVQPLISVTGKRTFIATLRDISARIKMEEDMKAALAKEKELNEMKSRFITMTSHEFRTPLSSIRSSVELLEMYAEDLGDRFMKPFEKHFSKITNQVNRINLLLQNIDTLGKIESSDMVFSPVSQNLLEFVTNLVNQQIKEEFPERLVEIKVEGDHKPQTFDPGLVDTLVYNICKNALIYSKEDVKCEVIFGGDYFELVVSDSGMGIPQEEMGHLFTSFFRAKNIVNHNIPGNGLGLVIAKKIVDLHSGTIDIDSEENKGTTVKIRIPQLIK